MIQYLIEKYILCIYLRENKRYKFYLIYEERCQLLREDNSLRFIDSQILIFEFLTCRDFNFADF